MKKTIGDIDWNKVGVQASIGMTTAEARNVDKLCTFVQHWSGGDDFVQKSPDIQGLHVVFEVLGGR